jgi:rubredoxin-NAD+ reductase
MAQQLNADIRIFTRVESVDAEQQTLTTSAGTLNYGKLVLATGARCIEAPLEGDALDQVYSINDLLDYTRFRTTMVGKKKVLVIGAGLIGSEYTNDLVQCDFDIDVVDPLDSVLATLLPKTASDSVKKALEAKGARFHFGTVVKRVDRNGQGVRATLGNGETIDADIVLSAIGVRPNLQLAENLGLTTNRGIVTDRTLKTSRDNIYSLGDCAEVDGHVLFYIAPLMECARALAQTLNGNTTAVNYGVMPVTVKTTLFPVVVNPPARDAVGSWHIEVDTDTGVQARFESDTGETLGFALTGDCISSKDNLAAQIVPVMDT